jgi:glycosyltransferase involved in cell wall biosynthesis
MRKQLTIVVPCKNEENYIGHLLGDLANQTDIEGVKIIVADAKSTDTTLQIIESFINVLNIEVIEGGLPAVARNRGAAKADTPYVLFIDSDARILDRDLILKSYIRAAIRDLDLLVPKLRSKHYFVDLLYMLNNLLVRLSVFDKPFAVGIFMLVKKSTFTRLGGFPEDVMHCEDYLLSRKVDPSKFGILPSFVYSDDRRFRKTGYWNMIRYVFKNILNRNDHSYFKQDINYWK